LRILYYEVLFRFSLNCETEIVARRANSLPALVSKFSISVTTVLDDSSSNSASLSFYDLDLAFAL
jgi:hypothetical protein